MRQDVLLLSVKDAAKLVNIGRSTAYELCRSGKWPTVRIGRSVRVPLKRLEEWIEAESQTTPHP